MNVTYELAFTMVSQRQAIVTSMQIGHKYFIILVK